MNLFVTHGVLGGMDDAMKGFRALTMLPPPPDVVVAIPEVPAPPRTQSGTWRNLIADVQETTPPPSR